MGKKKGKRTCAPPPDEKRCQRTISAGKRCKNSRGKHPKFCPFHRPGAARKAAKKSAERRSELKRKADETAAKWQVQNWGDTMAHTLRLLEQLEKDVGKMRRHQYWNLYWTGWGKFIEAQKAQATFEKGGFRVLLIREEGPDYWNRTKKPRPEPAEIDIDGGHKFKVPVEGTG